MNGTHKQKVTLGGRIELADLVAVARHGAEVAFSADYRERVDRSRRQVEQWVEEGRVMYGVTTGFGALCTEAIGREETSRLQENIILSHAVSVGEPMSAEQARATAFMVLQNLGQGHSGVRLAVLEKVAELLNKQVVPWMPREGSVGYLAPEAHLALVLTGAGRAWVDGELLDGAEALERAGIAPIALSSKEGLALISGTTSVTGLAALALYDMLRAARAADVVAALSLEASRGILAAFDPRVSAVRPHPHQGRTAENVRRILAGSEILAASQGDRVQDALSLRCVPQLHGAAKKTLEDALATVEIELNACCDNPIIWTGEGEADVISACNADSSYVGMEMDSACIAATTLAKMSERRNNRLIDESLSGLPWFLIRNPGLNSGLMIPQYTQAGLLGDMRMMCTPSVIDNTPTCGNQEDYVGMGYNAAKKAGQVVERLEYILAIELLSAYQAHGLIEGDPAPAAAAVLREIAETVPQFHEDVYLHPYIEYLRELIHSGRLVEVVEREIGPLG